MCIYLRYLYIYNIYIFTFCSRILQFVLVWLQFVVVFYSLYLHCYSLYPSTAHPFGQIEVETIFPHFPLALCIGEEFAVSTDYKIGEFVHEACEWEIGGVEGGWEVGFTRFWALAWRVLTLSHRFPTALGGSQRRVGVCSSPSLPGLRLYGGGVKRCALTSLVLKSFPSVSLTIPGAGKDWIVWIVELQAASSPRRLSPFSWGL